MATVKAVKNFAYPEEREVREEIRGFHKVKKNDGVVWEGNRGKLVEVAAGDVVEAPADLLESWVSAGLVETTGPVPTDSEEDTDG